MAAGQATAQHRAPGTSEELDPQPLPQSKEQPQTLLHSVAERERAGNSSRKREKRKGKKKKKGKKLDFKSETELVMGSLSPTRSAAPGALRPHRGHPGPGQSRTAGRRHRQVRRLCTYPSREEGGREDHCRTGRRTTRDKRGQKYKIKTRARASGSSSEGESRAASALRSPPLGPQLPKN